MIDKILEGNKLIAEFIGLKLGYFETYEDLSTDDDLNYRWKKKLVPITYKDSDVLTDVNLKDKYYLGGNKKYFKEPLPEDEQSKYYNILKYNTSWDALMPVVEKIQKLDIVDIWFQETEKDPYGFYTYVSYFPIGWKKYYWSIHPHNDQGKEHFNTKIEAVWTAVIQFIEWYNLDKK